LLFAMVLKAYPETLYRRTIRRLYWEYPEGLKVVGEYWLEADDPSAIVLVETESMEALTGCIVAWEDLMDIEIFPALTAEEGLEALRQKMS
jgi:Domain of unknown function (DUF3303)